EFLVPIFFVLMGMRVELRAFAQPGVLGLAALLTVAAIAGKQACALGVLGRGMDRLSVGIGMIPRGEVGLITASIGFAAGMISRGVYVQVIVLVLATTLITPALLKFAFARHRDVAEPVLAPLTVESATGEEFVSPV
ncbi:MAG: cation:proton antiporter, partial [Acidobacteriia bacterium]|nr:cation:proton antiporter [Terriglobia bacterium]